MQSEIDQLKKDLQEAKERIKKLEIAVLGAVETARSA